jgi:hypothetical protein
VGEITIIRLKGELGSINGSVLLAIKPSIQFDIKMFMNASVAATRFIPYPFGRFRVGAFAMHYGLVTLIGSPVVTEPSTIVA